MIFEAADYAYNTFEDRFVVNGSYGSLICSRDDGSVLAYLPDQSSMEYADIVRTDVAEYIKHYGELASHIDILDIGYWTDRAAYEPPEQEHRSIIADCVAAGRHAE